MFMPHGTIDELATLRLKLAELRAREATLEARLMEQHNEGLILGFTADVRIENNAHEVFDISKLPKEILNDSRFYSVKRVTSVRIEPHDVLKDISPFISDHPTEASGGPNASKAIGTS